MADLWYRRGRPYEAHSTNHRDTAGPRSCPVWLALPWSTTTPRFVGQPLQSMFHKPLCPHATERRVTPTRWATSVTVIPSARSNRIRPRLACLAGICVERCHQVSV